MMSCLQRLEMAVQETQGQRTSPAADNTHEELNTAAGEEPTHRIPLVILLTPISLFLSSN